jgi:malate dehydrogenase (oxaloacetate-decarboxylating)
LEDISAPRCFKIEDELQKQLDIPVMHDDQHGTAVVTTAVLTVACRKLKKDLGKAVIGQIGLGAAGNAIAKILMRITGNPVWGADLSEEALVRHEANGGKRSNLKEIMANCDIVVSTTGAQGLIKPEMVRKGQVILALSNPRPEIEPEVALKHGAAFAADGKLVNNVLGFPGIFRGAVDTWSPRISDEMLLAAAHAIANHTTDDQLVPNPLDRKLHQEVAHAVALKAIEQGLARADYVPYIHE